MDVWANLKLSRYDALLHWAARKLVSFGAFSKVETDYISGKVRVKVTGKNNFVSVGHEDDLFALISEQDKEKLMAADTKDKLGHGHLKYMDLEGKKIGTVKTLLQAAASTHFDQVFGQFYLAKFEFYFVVRLIIMSLRYFKL